MPTDDTVSVAIASMRAGAHTVQAPVSRTSVQGKRGETHSETSLFHPLLSNTNAIITMARLYVSVHDVFLD